MFEHLRDLVLADLDLPDTWHVVRAQRMPERIDRTTVAIRHTGMTPLPEAPIGNLRHSLVLNVSTHRTDIEGAEDALDADVLGILTRLDGHAWVNWANATKVDAPHLGWDIQLTAVTALPPKE